MASSSNNTYYDDKDFGDNQRIKKTQDEVEEVVGIMKKNLEKVLERDNKLTELHDRADALNQGAIRFEKNAVSLKRKMWWKNMKMMLIIGGIVTVLIIIIIVWISSSFGSDDSSKTPQPPQTR